MLRPQRSQTDMRGVPGFEVWRADPTARMVIQRALLRLEALETELLGAVSATTDPKVARAFGNYQAAYEVYALLTKENRDG